MEIITEEEYRKRLKSGIKGAYLFFGAEDYLKAYALKATRKVVCPDDGFGCFNDITIDFPDFTIDRLLAALEAPPLMADRKLVVLFEGRPVEYSSGDLDELTLAYATTIHKSQGSEYPAVIVVLKSFDFGALKPTECEAMAQIFEEYGKDETNVLVVSVVPEGIDAGYLPNRPSAFLKRLAKAGTAVNFVPSKADKLSVWVERHFEHEGVRISPKTARAVVAYCGSDMMKLSGEISKLCSFAKANGRDSVSEEDVRFVAVPETDFDPFALSNAAMAGDKAAALNALEVLKFRQVKPEFVMAEMSGLYVALYLTKLLSVEGLSQSEIGIALSRKPYSFTDYKAGMYLKAVENLSLDRLKKALELCLDADLAMKTYGKRNYEQVERLICLL